MSDSVKFVAGVGAFLVLVGMAATIESATGFFLFEFGQSAGSEAPAHVIQLWEAGIVVLAFSGLLWGFSGLFGGR